MKTIIYTENSKCVAVGRNGTMNCIGLNISVRLRSGDGKHIIDLTPVNSKGLPGHCVIEFPADDIGELIDYLNEIKGALS